MTEEKIIKVSNGYFMLFLLLVFIVGIVTGIVNEMVWLILLSIFLTLLTLPGFFLVNPNTSKVILLFGKYIGTVKDNGFYWANPFYRK